jgi:hypothetical protein
MKSYSHFHDFYLIKAVEFSGVYEGYFMISGARTPHGLSSGDSEIESASRKLGGFAPLIGARDKIEPPGGAALKCELW